MVLTLFEQYGLARQKHTYLSLARPNEVFLNSELFITYV